jgi:hypothetical protein
VALLSRRWQPLMAGIISKIRHVIKINIRHVIRHLIFILQVVRLSPRARTPSTRARLPHVDPSRRPMMRFHSPSRNPRKNQVERMRLFQMMQWKKQAALATIFPPRKKTPSKTKKLGPPRDRRNLRRTCRNRRRSPRKKMSRKTSSPSTRRLTSCKQTTVSRDSSHRWTT